MLNQPPLAAEFVSAAQQRLNFGQQQVQVKGLCNKVIGTQAQGHDLIQIVGGGGEKNHRNPAHPADLAAPVVAAVTGQPYVQKHQLRCGGHKFFQHMGKVPGADGLITPAFQLFRHQAGDDRVILHNKNFMHDTFLSKVQTGFAQVLCNRRSDSAGE